MNGIASWLTCVPNSEIVAAVHSFAKFGWRKRLRRAVGGHVAPRLVGGPGEAAVRHVSVPSNTR